MNLMEIQDVLLQTEDGRANILDIRQKMRRIRLDHDIYQDRHERIRTLVLVQMPDEP